MPIRITIDDKSWLTEDLTLDECAEIEAETGENWLTVLAAPTRSAKISRAIIKQFMARDCGADEAVKRAGSLTMKQVSDAFDVVDDDRPDMHENGVPVVDPKADGDGGVTTSSSSSQRNTGGRRT